VGCDKNISLDVTAKRNAVLEIVCSRAQIQSELDELEMALAFAMDLEETSRVRRIKALIRKLTRRLETAK
jgi:hypothetical protein